MGVRVWMRPDPERRARLEAELERYLQVLRREPTVRRVLLFGSLAEGNPGPASDIDLLIVQETDRPFLKRLEEWYERLDPRLATDILVYTPEEADALKDTPTTAGQALRRGRVLYEAEPKG